MSRQIWQISKRDLTICLRVTPNASRNSITGIYTDTNGNMSLKVSTTAQPEKGKANKAVIAIIAKTFGKAKSDFSVVSGKTDRNKTLQIVGPIDDIKQWLLPILKEIENA